MAAERIQSGAAGRTSGGVEDRVPVEPTVRTALVPPEADGLGEGWVGGGIADVFERREDGHVEYGGNAAGEMIAAKGRTADRPVDVPGREPRVFDVDVMILTHGQA